MACAACGQRARSKTGSRQRPPAATASGPRRPHTGFCTQAVRVVGDSTGDDGARVLTAACGCTPVQVSVLVPAALVGQAITEGLTPVTAARYLPAGPGPGAVEALRVAAVYLEGDGSLQGLPEAWRRP